MILDLEEIIKNNAMFTRMIDPVEFHKIDDIELPKDKIIKEFKKFNIDPLYTSEQFIKFIKEL